MLLQKHAFMLFKAYSIVLLGIEWIAGKKKKSGFRTAKELPEPNFMKHRSNLNTSSVLFFLYLFSPGNDSWILLVLKVTGNLFLALQFLCAYVSNIWFLCRVNICKHCALQHLLGYFFSNCTAMFLGEHHVENVYSSVFITIIFSSHSCS